MFDEWEIWWSSEKCRDELGKEGHIVEGESDRGRDRKTKRVTGARREIGEVMAAGYKGERHWFRDKGEVYEIDLTIDSGAVATIAPNGTLPGEKPRETEASRRGMSYMVANGAAIVNKGEITLMGKGRQWDKYERDSASVRCNKAVSGS